MASTKNIFLNTKFWFNPRCELCVGVFLNVGYKLTTLDVLLSFPQLALFDPWEDAPGDGLGYGGAIVLSSLFDLSTVRVPTGGGVTDENDDDPWNPGDDVLPNNDLVLSPKILFKGRVPNRPFLLEIRPLKSLKWFKLDSFYFSLFLSTR